MADPKISARSTLPIRLRSDGPDKHEIWRSGQRIGTIFRSRGAFYWYIFYKGRFAGSYQTNDRSPTLHAALTIVRARVKEMTIDWEPVTNAD